MTHVACESKLYVQLWGHPCIHVQETGWRSGVRSCVFAGLPTHLVQDLQLATVHTSDCVGDLSLELARTKTLVTVCLYKTNVEYAYRFIAEMSINVEQGSRYERKVLTH